MGKVKKRAKLLYQKFAAGAIGGALYPAWKYLRADWKKHFKRRAKAELTSEGKR